MFAVIGSRGENLFQLAQKLGHLVRGEFQSAVQVNTVEQRGRAAVLRTFDSLRELETRVAHDGQFDGTASPWAPALLLERKEFNIKAHASRLPLHLAFSFFTDMTHAPQLRCRRRMRTPRRCPIHTVLGWCAKELAHGPNVGWMTCDGGRGDRQKQSECGVRNLSARSRCR